MPEISVIMPVYNTQQYLNQSIHSVMNQSFTDFELILINDGSTDYSFLFCQALAKQDSRIRLLDLPHGGVTAARLAGIAAAQGNYVGFVDSDDWVEKDYLLHLVQAIRAEDADIAMCPHIQNSTDQSIEIFFPGGSYRESGLQELILSEVFCRNSRSVSGLSHFIWDKLFKKLLLLENIKYLDNRLVLGEDTLLFVACLLSSKCFTIHDACDYHYCLRENSITHNKQREIDFDKILLYYHLEIEILKQKGWSCLKEKAETQVLQMIAGFIKNRSNTDIPSLPEEFSALIEAQSENDGGEEWKNTVRTVKDYYYSTEKNDAENICHYAGV